MINFEDGLIDNSQMYVKSVIRALLILEQFIGKNKEMGIYELSASTSLPASTVQRLVNTLHFKGYLIQNPKNDKYRLSYSLYNLGRSIMQNRNWVEDATSHMEQLVKKHQETINLGVLEPGGVAYLNKVDCNHIIRPTFTIGTRYPVHCSALGKCLLAFLPTNLVSNYLSEPLEQYTSSTITNMDKLNMELLKVRELGYAVDDEELQENLCCAAVPVRDFNMDGVVVAALSVAAPKSRMPKERRAVIIEDLFEVSRQISKYI